MTANMKADKNQLNSHLSHLSSEDRDRYDLKLTVHGEKLQDPFALAENKWQNNIAKWPAVQYGDIWNYLINTPGLYTAEAMKAYKSMDGYNFFISGHVQEVLLYELNKHVCFLKSTVIPSQKVSDKKQWHRVWVCLGRSQGYIISAHCTCKAGLGEACSHVAALLFKVEAAVKLDLTNPSKTSAACVWNRHYREKVTAQPISKLDFSRPRHGKVSKRKINPAPDTDTESDEDMDQEAALRALKRICPNACVLTKDDSDTDTASDDEEMPPLLVRECAIRRELTKEALESECRNFIQDFSVNPTQASNLEKMTRSQTESGLWKRQRVGRITSSIVHSVKTLKEGTNRKNCLKKIMREDQKDLSAIPSIRYGVENERKAKKQYHDIMVMKHDGFEMRDCGLVIDTAFPMFGASPDGVRTCQCHGEGLVEVKCCFKHKDLLVNEIPEKDGQFYLEPVSLKLKESHQYYTQVQFQMFVCGKQFCDFIVLTDRGIYIQTVYYNSAFVKDLVDRCTEFALTHLVPCLITKKMASENCELDG